jgi:hypothetical protein
MKKFRLNGIGPCYLVGDGQGDLQGGAGGTGDSTGGQSNLQGGNADFNFEEFKSTYGKNYADKGFMQELTTPEKMFEKIDNMESLIGKKSFVPGEGATEQDWNDYRDRVGIKSTDDYVLDNSDLPDNVKNLHNDEIQGKVKQMFYDAGLTPQQAKIINSRYDQIMTEAHKDVMEQYAAQQKQAQLSDEEFDNLAKETWGQERDNVINVAKSLIQEFTPPNLKEAMTTMDNKSLTIMASVLKGVSDKYISQDDLDVLKGNNTNNPESLREEAQKELAKLSQMSQFDKGYAAQQQKVNDLYGALSKNKK